MITANVGRTCNVIQCLQGWVDWPIVINYLLATSSVGYQALFIRSHKHEILCPALAPFYSSYIQSHSCVNGVLPSMSSALSIALLFSAATALQRVFLCPTRAFLTGQLCRVIAVDYHEEKNVFSI